MPGRFDLRNELALRGQSTQAQKHRQRWPEAMEAMRKQVKDRPLQPITIAKPATVAPLSADQYKIQFTIPKATHAKLRRVQDLMRHTNPKGDPAVIFDRALTLLVDHLEKAKLGRRLARGHSNGRLAPARGTFRQR